MSITKQSFLFFMKSPRFSDLLIVYLDIKNCYEDEFDVCPETQFDSPKQKRNRCQRILKCRQLIFSEENIIASPDYDRLQKIVAVIPKARYNMPEFKECIRNMDLLILSCHEVDASVLQACIQYTVMAKMAPSWNVVNNLLVQGRDFLTCSGRLTAVELNMSASEKEIILCIKPLNVVIPHGRVEDYGDKELIAESLIIHCNKPCYVLPSVRRAWVKSVVRHINGSTFKNYSELKKYWKNMYGYRLPDVPEENMCCFNIVFNTNTGIHDAVAYTYPLYCVRSSPLIFKRTGVNYQSVLCSFIGDFCKRLGNVCGEKCKILDTKACFPFLQFYPAQQVRKDMKPRPGTTYNVNTSTASCVDRSKTNFIGNYNANIDPCPQENQDLNLKGKTLQNTSHRFSSVYSENVVRETLLDRESQQLASVSCSSMTQTTEKKSQPKYAPHFYPKKRTSPSKTNSTNLVLENNLLRTLQKRQVPKFSSKKSNTGEYVFSNLTSAHEREKNSIKNQAYKVTSRKKTDISLKSTEPKEDIHFPDNGNRIFKDFERGFTEIKKSNKGKGKKKIIKKAANESNQNEEKNARKSRRSKIKSRDIVATKIENKYYKSVEKN